jgi:hypothetical protein
MEQKNFIEIVKQTINQKLIFIQSELKAPKSQYNSFGKYSYRNCEDILEAFKPLGLKYGAAVTVSDEIVLVGDRYYVKATARLIDGETGESISNAAYAREEDSKKGMDGSQVTGSTSSYARKYALNGLFAIDDTKDSDTPKTREELREMLINEIKKSGLNVDAYAAEKGLNKNTTAERYQELLKEFNS